MSHLQPVKKQEQASISESLTQSFKIYGEFPINSTVRFLMFLLVIEIFFPIYLTNILLSFCIQIIY